MAAPAVGIVPPNPMVSAVDMHGWSVEQIESHIDLLRQLKQEVPQKITLLLQDAKKRADKRHAKRIANRQSACTSRARKKALVEEMTALNAKLRRQALILSLLPDLVIVIDTEGTITFCSAQVERVLQHSTDELVGAKLTDIIEPGSRDKFTSLIQGLLKSNGSNLLQENWKNRSLTASQHLALSSEQQLHNSCPNDSSPVTKKKKAKSDDGGEGNDDSAYETSGAGANAVTETSFPLSVVQVGQVNTTVRSSSDENDNSDASNSKQPSSLTGNSVAGNSGFDETEHKKTSSALENAKKLSKEDTSISQSSDASNTSSQTISSNAQNLLSANANLERNVRHHNKKIMKDKRAGYKDDVLGAAVTANNASARLSSLQHLRSADSSEEDSGYRESNDSREETSSSSDGEAPPKRNGTRKTIAPTCNVCLIRNDLTTIWCEVTSSLRTKDNDDEEGDANSWTEAKKPPQLFRSGESASVKLETEEASMHGSEEAVPAVKNAIPQVKEILLCLRPIRDGDGKTDESNRFKPHKKVDHIVSEDNRSSEATSASITDVNVTESIDTVSAVNPWSANGNRRKRSSKDSLPRSNKKKHGASDEDIDTAVVESLMLMSNKKV